MIISGLQPETSYSLTVTAYTTKGDGARSKPKLVSTTGAGKHICAYMCLQYLPGDNNTNFPNSMVNFIRSSKWAVVNFCAFLNIQFRRSKVRAYFSQIIQSVIQQICFWALSTCQVILPVLGIQQSTKQKYSSYLKLMFWVGLDN